MAEEFKFPENFYWGSSTASYQVEGGIENNDWAEAAKQGKVPVAGRACNQYNFYKGDFDIAKSLGQNAHRFSIEWSRIEPEEGKFDEKEIEHYRQVIQALKERGLEPFVTLWHYTLPIWFAKMGGFENPKSPDIFARYCNHVLEKLGGEAKFWITINEPMVYIGFGYATGWYPPFKKNIFATLRVMRNLITSHNIVYQNSKKLNKDIKLGIAFSMARYMSNSNPINIVKSKLLDYFGNFRFLNKTVKYSDFIGLNYYMPKQFGSGLKLEKNDMGWDIYPKGIYDLLFRLKKYNKTVYITENGIPDAKDQKRAKFIEDHLYWVGKAINAGVDIHGYLYWSLVDNYEWTSGFKPRFGLIEINYETLQRHVRPSAYKYKQICETNSLIIGNINT
jgi:beta-glucosidase